eukprot:403361080
MGLSKKQQVGLILLSFWFLVYAYQSFQNNKDFSNNLSTQYNKLYSLGNLHVKKWSRGNVKLLDPETFALYKQKIAYGITYSYVLCSLGVIFCYKKFLFALIPLHILLSAFLDNPYAEERPSDFIKKCRECVIDLMILAALIVMAGMPIAKDRKQRVSQSTEKVSKKGEKIKQG